MKHQYINLKNQKDIIEGVILRKLAIHRDKTGQLIETLRKDWTDVFNSQDLNFTMQYMSITPSKVARDEDKWHVHKYQKDRFICVSGKIVTAIFDPREDSKTKEKLNLFIMGPEKIDEMYMIVIPQNTYHSFLVISKKPAFLLNYPTQLYNPQDEGRIANNQLKWSDIRKDFNI